MTVRFTHRQFMSDGTESTVIPVGSQAAKDAIARVKAKLYGDLHPYTPERAKVYHPRPCQWSDCGETIIGPGYKFCPAHAESAAEVARQRQIEAKRQRRKERGVRG